MNNLFCFYFVTVFGGAPRTFTCHQRTTSISLTMSLHQDASFQHSIRCQFVSIPLVCFSWLLFSSLTKKRRELRYFLLKITQSLDDDFCSYCFYRLYLLFNLSCRTVRQENYDSSHSTVYTFEIFFLSVFHETYFWKGVV